MSSVETRVLSAGRDEDRLAVRIVGDAALIVVADGAGGVAGGRRAAEAICARIVDGKSIAQTDWPAVLARLDLVLSADPKCGESTAVVAFISAGKLRGASVGDSEAWLVHDDGRVECLTEHQRRKPLLGSGQARPVAFEAELSAARLLVATDGLFKYARHAELLAAARDHSLETAADGLVRAARLPNGGLQDDVALALLRST